MMAVGGREGGGRNELLNSQRRQAPSNMFSLIELFRNKQRQHQRDEDVQLELQIQRDIEDVFGEIFEEDEELEETVSLISPSLLSSLSGFFSKLIPSLLLLRLQHPNELLHLLPFALSKPSPRGSSRRLWTPSSEKESRQAPSSRLARGLDSSLNRKQYPSQPF